MFDVLEADIVVFQETKIQRKDLSDDMVLVLGWDCYWSLPKHKKGNSGTYFKLLTNADSPKDILASSYIQGSRHVPQYEPKKALPVSSALPTHLKVI